MRLILWSVAVAVVCGCVDAPSSPTPLAAAQAPLATDGVEPADAGDVAWVQRVVPLLWGRRVLSSQETRVLADLTGELGRTEMVRVMSKHPEYVDRWELWLKDALSVSRLGFAANPVCYGTSNAEVAGVPDPALAEFVAEHGPAEGDYESEFTLRDLIRSALVLDDLSVVYRAHLIAHLTRALDDMRLLAAMSQRRNRAQTFMTDYLNRQMSCLGCHNSEFSVTDAVDPDEDRAWPVEGPFERQLFLEPTGLSDVDELAGFFRRKGVLAGYHYTHDDAELIQTILGQDGTAPWGWDGGACGEYLEPAERSPDDALTLAGEPQHSLFIVDHGTDGDVFDLEAYLHKGVDELKATGPPADTSALSAEASFAYMVASSVVDQVWEAAFGHRLTIATHFPRNRYQRDLLAGLVATTIEHKFSLREVLVAVTTHPYFNGALPSTGVAYRPVFDPFVDDSQPVTERRNGIGHTIRRADARVLLRSLSAALNWPDPPEFLLYYMSPDARNQRSVGVFLKTGDPGFSGTSFQSALAWESLYGTCVDQSQISQCPLEPILDNAEAQLATVKELCASRFCACDWDARCCDVDWDQYCTDDVDTGDPDTLNLCSYPRPEAPAYGDTVRRLAEAGLAAEVSWGDLLAALKDRLLGSAAIDETDERGALEALLGVSLGDRPSGLDNTESTLRLACGLWLATPSFHLLGDPGVADDELGVPVPALLPDVGYEPICTSLKAALQLTGLDCQPDSLRLQ